MGPQGTQYIPGPLLKAGNNEIILVETELAPNSKSGEASLRCKASFDVRYYDSAFHSQQGANTKFVTGYKERHQDACFDALSVRLFKRVEGYIYLKCSAGQQSLHLRELLRLHR